MSDPNPIDPKQEVTEILEAASRRPRPPGALYAGCVTPAEAHRLHELGTARLVDVRTEEERDYVGHVPGSLHVVWRPRGATEPNARFVEDLAGVARRDETILLLCRSAHRSKLAGNAAAQAGFTAVYDVLEGFEGDLDANGHRGTVGGWRFRGLPWTQG
ncbi:MAG: hypothetical protein RIS35_1837 [Pseudomonadota bacterium]